MATRSERHPRLLLLIANGEGKQGVESLAAALRVSSKTVRRDIASLRDVGVAIQEQIGDNGQKCYWLSKESLPQIKFAYDEALAMMLCRSGIRAFDGTPLGEASETAFEKITQAIGPMERRFLERMLPRIHIAQVGSDYAAHGEILDALTLGIEENRATFITYRSNRSTEPVTYDIFPYAMAEHRGSLYVVGWHNDEELVKTWKVDRMSDAEVTEIRFERPADFNAQEHFRGAFAIVTGDESITVRVRFTGTAARYVQEKRMHPTQQVEVLGQSLAEVTFELTSTMEIKSWVLSFGASAEVLEPQELRDEIQAELAAATNLYASEQIEK
ncbi:helix-turn-helix transcriptional regulator [Rosistilla oblonga]|uniref:HTH domain protein n=1 Tax=Rosistilla oblonga TaxID=2527990 RepID=A0A518IMD4_9BACT|nr:WYL domain-containing transcriptional regulator [Rosistilla oblonga]QDV54247.1 hypothetical protein Mal33_01970 [Rosistilla oblonga]